MLRFSFRRCVRALGVADTEHLWRQVSREENLQGIGQWHELHDSEVARRLTGVAQMQTWWSAVGRACPLIVSPECEAMICKVRAHFIRLLASDPSALPSQSSTQLLQLAENLGFHGQQNEHVCVFSDEELLWAEQLSVNTCPVEWRQMANALLDAYPFRRMGAIHSTATSETGSCSIVQQFYESYPYPRWRTLEPWADTAALPKPLREAGQSGQSVLVAGCGTGRWASHFAASFPKVSVLAVDVSRNSLAFAEEQKLKFGLDNIRFEQADLRCWSAPDLYDFIECGGVLHHLDDPLDAWSRLTSCLRPGGTMLVALYSRLARWPFKEMRREILPTVVEGGAPPSHVFAVDDATVRRFRHELLKQLWIPDMMPVARCADFHSLARLRDCFFHPLEHEYSLLEVQAMLDGLGLELLSLEGPKELFRRCLPNADMTDLKAWHELEQRMPGIFLGMYRMYVRSKK